MTPTATVEAPVSSGSPSMDAELGSLLSDAYDSASGGESPSGEIGDQSSSAEESVSEPEIQLGSLEDETPVAEAKPVAKTEAEKVASPGEPYPLDPTGKSYLVPKNELPQLQSARQFHQEVSKYFSNPEEAQTAYLQASDLRTMQNDWNYGSPETIEAVISHWAGKNQQNPQVRQRFENSFVKMSSKVPEMLKSINPEAYKGLVDSMVTQAISLEYEKAAKTGNPEDFKRAQELDWGKTGTYKKELQKPDPQAEQRTRDEQKREDFDKRQNVALKRDVDAYNNEHVEGAKFNQLNSMIDKILGPVKDRYGDVAYTDLKEGIKRELFTSLKSQSEFWREHEQTWAQLMEDYRTTWRNGQSPSSLDPRVKSFVSSFISQAKRALPAIAQKRVNGTTAVRLQQPARGPDGKFQASSARSPQPAPTNGTQSSIPSSATNGKMSSEQWDKEWADAWRSPA